MDMVIYMYMSEVIRKVKTQNESTAVAKREERVQLQVDLDSDEC